MRNNIMNIKQLVDEAVALPVEERAQVVASLLRSLNQSESEINEKWMVVARKHLIEIRSAAVEVVSGEKYLSKSGKDLINDLFV